MNENAVVVTGMGCICAAGNCLPDAMAAMYARQRNVYPPRQLFARDSAMEPEAKPRRYRAGRRLTVELDRAYPVFQVDAKLLTGSYDATNHPIPPSRTSRLAVHAALEAALQAGLTRIEPARKIEDFTAEEQATLEARLGHPIPMEDLEELFRMETDKVRLKAENVGVCLGTTVGCTLNDEAFYRQFRKTGEPDIFPICRYLISSPAVLVAREFGIQGSAVTLANACSSGADAIGLAKLWLETGQCDVVIAGGADELSRMAYLGFISLLITSEEPCRPFDRRRQGLNLGEGAGVLVLETAKSARRRGARPLAEVAGYGCAADAHHPTGPHPEGAGLRRAIECALHEAGAAPEDVGVINAHGTATPDNDRVEGRVLHELFPGTPVVSTKSYTGHTLGAAGGLEAAFAVQSLLDRKLPATAGCEEPDPECGLTPTKELIQVHAQLALSTSLAFGGGNSALLFRRID